MSMTRILSGLEMCNARDDEAQAVARLGFLEWAFTEPGQVTAETVKDALRHPATKAPGSAAARAFVDYLRQAVTPLSAGRARRGRARALH